MTLATICAVLATVADVWTTMRAKRAGAREANPLLAGTGWVTVRVAMTVGLVLVAWVAGAPVWMVWAMAAIWGAVAVWNWGVWRRQRAMAHAGHGPAADTGTPVGAKETAPGGRPHKGGG